MPIPTDATAVVLNVTEVAGTASSLLTVYPYGTRMPKASNLNFAPGKVIANLVTVTLGQGGAVDIYNALGTVNVLADVEGYFAPDASPTVSGEFHPISPVRVCDTRSTSHNAGVQGAWSHRPRRHAMLVNVTGTGADAIPSDGTAAAVVRQPHRRRRLRARPISSLSPTTSTGTCPYSGSNAPKFSTINVIGGTGAANRVMVALGPSSPGGHDTSLCVYIVRRHDQRVLIDAGGWFGSGDRRQPASSTRRSSRPASATREVGGVGCAGPRSRANGASR